MICHPIPALYDNESRVLILGSFPSPRSRTAGFFYGHPQNRFWKVMANVLQWDGTGGGQVPETGVFIPQTTEEKSLMLHRSHIAVWDTIASCEITGASDASITDVTPNDLSPILQAADIRQMFCNGTKSYDLYMKYIFPVTGIKPVKLPSTSPANAAWSVERLTEAWSMIRGYL